MTVNLTSLKGRRLGLTPKNDLVSNERIIVPGPRNRGVLVDMFDDFLGDLIADEWSSADGSDAESTLATIVAAQNGGWVRLTSGDGGAGTEAVDAAVLTQGLNWRAANGGLTFETRLKMSAITNISVFCGFTDVLATTTLEIPIKSASSANTLTTNATDAVGFMFDTAMTADTWWLTGVANGTDATHYNTTEVPVAATFQKFRIELDVDGNADFWINGDLVGSVEDAVTSTVLLTPVISVLARTTTAHTVDADYIYCSQLRA